MGLTKEMEELALRSRAAAHALYTAPISARNRALLEAAKRLHAARKAVIAANARDLLAARRGGASPAILDRLLLDQRRISAMVKGLREVAKQPDPVGHVDRVLTRPNGLVIKKVRVPLGSILFVYESRPNVTIDAAGLCLKSGNAVILRGGREAFESSRVLVDLFRAALKSAGLPRDAIARVNTQDHKALPILLRQSESIDLVIPRGGEGLIRAVTAHSLIPVLKHYKGVCHVYLDRYADPAMAENVAVNAKVQRPAVCNAMETLLWDQGLARGTIRRVLRSLMECGVKILGCPETVKLLPGIHRAVRSDYYKEYLALTLSVKCVDGVQGAVEHIRTFGSGHTEAIVTRNRARAGLFVERTDSSSVMWNASTRFADGGEYGLGAEVGISTDKLHARGPMGAEDLTTYKWVVVGKGHVRE